VGVDVHLMLVNQSGTSRRRRRDTEVSFVSDADFVFATFLEREQHCGRTPMLARIDPCRDLELTAAEMPQLISELDIGSGVARSEVERDRIWAVRHLAKQCRDDPALRLLFAGD
jgi:hypothetical protein